MKVIVRYVDCGDGIDFFVWMVLRSGGMSRFFYCSDGVDGGVYILSGC